MIKAEKTNQSTLPTASVESNFLTYDSNIQSGDYVMILSFEYKQLYQDRENLKKVKSREEELKSLIHDLYHDFYKPAWNHPNIGPEACGAMKKIEKVIPDIKEA